MTGNLTPEQVAAQSPHELVDPVHDVYAVSNDSGFGGTVVPRKGVQSADPAVMLAPHRQAVVGSENGGAAYRIGYGLDRPIDPAAGATMQHARIIPPSISREAGFLYGQEDY